MKHFTQSCQDAEVSNDEAQATLDEDGGRYLEAATVDQRRKVALTTGDSSNVRLRSQRSFDGFLRFQNDERLITATAAGATPRLRSSSG